MRLRTGVTVVAALLLLAGCAMSQGAEERPALTASSPLSAAVDIASLEEHRTPYLGDNSRVVALVEATGAEAVGDLTLELLTDQPPYQLVLGFSSIASDVTDDVADELLVDRAVLLMATIDNLDEVRWELPGRSGPGGALDRAEADTLVGSPVADLGTTADELAELVERLENAGD